MVGRRWSRFIAVALMVAVVCLGSAAAAGAASEGDTGGAETGGYGIFTLKASHGYWMLVFASSKAEFKEGEAAVWLFGRHEAALYSAPATVTDTEIRVDLGSLGRIAVDFKPTGKGEFVPKCGPREKIPYEKGFYEGEIEFHGEEGFADVSATRAPSSFPFFIEAFCGGYSIEETIGHGLPGARLTAITRRKREKISLQVNQNRPGARVEVQAEIAEKRGRVQIERVSDGRYPATTLHFDPRLRSASLRPPAPFSGSALYRRDARPSNRWTGSLAVALPGRSNVSLTGGRFGAQLVHARVTRTPFIAERPARLTEEPGPMARALYRRSRYVLR